VTGDAEARRIIEDARLLGVERDTAARYRNERSWTLTSLQPGWRYHMKQYNGCDRPFQLGRLMESLHQEEVALARRYRTALESVRGVALLDTDLGPVVPIFNPYVFLMESAIPLDETLHERGIETGLHYKPNHLLTFFGGRRDSYR